MSTFEDTEEFRARVGLIKLTYLYYKHDSIYEKIKDRITAKGGPNVEEKLGNVYLMQHSQEQIDATVKHIIKYGAPRMRVRATLNQVYHHALHNRVKEARDLLLKTHMATLIGAQPVENQILYNRSITQTGMAAFRAGNMALSHEVLLEIYQNQRYRELLGQGINKNPEKTPEQEAEERKRLIPLHMQISLQGLESIHYITSMLMEIPMFAENQHAMRKQVVSRMYRKLIDHYENRQTFVLAAEQSRDHIVFAARALNKQDWKTALKHIFSITPLVKMPEFETGNLQETLSTAFKTAALRAYLFRATNQYTSFSFGSLSTIFELEKKQVKKIVSQLII